MYLTALHRAINYLEESDGMQVATTAITQAAAFPALRSFASPLFNRRRQSRQGAAPSQPGGARGGGAAAPGAGRLSEGSGALPGVWAKHRILKASGRRKKALSGFC